MMLQMLRIYPVAIPNAWPTLKACIEKALPPTTEDHAGRMNLVLASALSGRLEIFILFREGQEKKIIGVIVFERLKQVDADKPTLFIYALYGTGLASGKDWVRLVDMVKDYARDTGCQNIAALSKEPSVIKIIKIMGGEVDYHLLTLEV
jgi:hypothetical protein